MTRITQMRVRQKNGSGTGIFFSRIFLSIIFLSKDSISVTRSQDRLKNPQERTINNFRISALKGMFAADMPSLEGLRHATQIRKLFVAHPRDYRPKPLVPRLLAGGGAHELPPAAPGVTPAVAPPNDAPAPELTPAGDPPNNAPAAGTLTPRKLLK